MVVYRHTQKFIHEKVNIDITANWLTIKVLRSNCIVSDNNDDFWFSEDMVMGDPLGSVVDHFRLNSHCNADNNIFPYLLVQQIIRVALKKLIFTRVLQCTLIVRPT